MADVDHRDRGQAIVLLLAFIVVTVVLMVAMGHFSARLVDQQQAQLAADAAALAGVVGGRDAAERLATANDGVLVAFVVAGDEVMVEVRVGSELAQARATRAPESGALPTLVSWITAHRPATNRSNDAQRRVHERRALPAEFR